MSLLDQEVSKQKLKSQGLVNVNFKGLLKAITDNAQYQFEFKQFFDEFTNKISNRSKTDFKVINFNLENIAFLLDSAEAVVSYHTSLLLPYFAPCLDAFACTSSVW